ncbi:MAG: DUF2254 domain-containing protein [Verrucomicrobiota bacterium]
MKTFFSALLQRWRSSYWFLPALLAASATAFSFLTVHADSLINAKWARATGWIWAGGPEGARQVLATIAGSTITVAGVVFSVTIVSLTLASSQFGPRLLRTFLNDRGAQAVLGVFVATFLYCLLVLRTIRGTDTVNFVPFLSVTIGLLLAVTSVAFLIYFVHHISTSILADNLTARVAAELQKGIERLYPDQIGHEEESSTKSEQDLPAGFEEQSQPMLSRESGYIQAIAVEDLLELAQENDLVLRLSRRPGEFVALGASLGSIWPQEKINEEQLSRLRDAYYFGTERTPTQDVEYSIDQLVEVAVRALSPGINDPFTALTCLEWLGDSLIRLAGRKMPSPFICDEHGKLRVVTKSVTFAGLADAALNQIRQYGSKSVAVVLRQLNVLERIAPHLRRVSDREVLYGHARKIRDDGCARVQNGCDRTEIEERFAAVDQALGRSSPSLPEAGQ